jgi:hypothetical protein
VDIGDTECAIDAAVAYTQFGRPREKQRTRAATAAFAAAATPGETVAGAMDVTTIASAGVFVARRSLCGWAIDGGCQVLSMWRTRTRL